MAAYAALVSLMTTLNNIQTHPRVSTFFHHKHIQSLHQIINVLLDFIESSNSHGGNREVEALECRITSTAHAAEDVIESHVVHQLHAGSSDLLDLETQIQAMNSVKETVMVFLGTMKFKERDQQSSASSKLLTTTKKDFMVGFDEKVIQIMDRLTGQQLDLQVVPIVGMGGIGKTTLARSVYDNLLTVESFDIRAWVTISQQYNVKYVLSELLSCVGVVDCETGLETECHQLGLMLYQTLSGRRYLIVLDDMWSVEAWDKIKCFFPNNGQRSRVVITTRIWSVATHFSSSSCEMNFLDEDQSWELFCRNVFLGKGCPPELKEIGKKIVRECKGLPLSIVVIGGLLRNSRSTSEYWENFARDLNSILMSGNDGHCLSILSLSYNHLPAHLKPCFLYMGVFKEDVRIRVSQLINLFVAEGFLKSIEGQTLEDVAESYINDLIDRNLILADIWKRDGKIKYCKMHDLVRDICLKIGEKEKIFHWMKMLDIPKGVSRERRIVFDGLIPVERNWPRVFDALPSARLVRTFLCNGGPLPFKFLLLRVLSCVKFESVEDISQHVNLRYLEWRSQHESPYSTLPSSISLFWNVQTLIFGDFVGHLNVPSEIWYMRQLRNVKSYMLYFPDPPPSEKVKQQDDDVLLPNLQKLSRLVNFNFSEEVCKRIPNIKKLGILHTDNVNGVECKKKCYYYLNHLHKLQSLECCFQTPEREDFLQSLVFPSSLRKLSLQDSRLNWEELNTFGLSLPNLQVLKLYNNAAVGPEWNCVEGAFPRLKFLHLACRDLIKWTAESSDFPVLEKLLLAILPTLEEIPSSIGEIQTLESLCLISCNLSTAISSIEILEEQLSLGNENFELMLSLRHEDEKRSFMEKVDIKSFPTKNFKFQLS